MTGRVSLNRRWGTPLLAAILLAGACGCGRTATVTREVAQSRPSSSVQSTSHTHVVRPRWRRVARAWIVPSLIGRRKLVALERPVASCPCDTTTSAVAHEASDSAIAA